MGALLGLIGYGTKGPEPLKFLERVQYIFERHWRGIVGSLVPFLFIPLALSGKHEDTCLYVWSVMALLWIIEPVSPHVTGMIPIFAFPIFGIVSSGETCMYYLSDMTALLLLGSMMWALFSYSSVDKRFACWIMKITGPSHPKMLLGICIASALLSMVTLKMLVTAMMIPLVEELLNKLNYHGQEAPYTSTTVGGETKKSANKLAIIYYLAVGSSAAIGSIGFINSSMVTLLFLGQMETRYPIMPDEFNYMSFSMFTIPVMLIMLTLNYVYLLVLLQPGKRKIGPDAQKAIKTYLKDKHSSLGRFTPQQMVATISMFLLLILLLFRHPLGFNGWAKIIQDNMAIPEKLTSQPRYIRNSAVCAIFVIVLHSLPSDGSIFKYCKHNKKSQLPPVKTTPSVLSWAFSNKNCPWGYLFVIGGAIALIGGAEKSSLFKTFSNWAGMLELMPWAVAAAVLVIVAVTLANLINFVAACGILMPIVINMGSKLSVCPLIPPLALGLACSLTFTLPKDDTPTSKLKTMGYVKTRKLLTYGVGCALICAIVLIASLLVYSGLIFNCADTAAWEARGAVIGDVTTEPAAGAGDEDR